MKYSRNLSLSENELKLQLNLKTSIHVKPKVSSLSTNKSDLEKWLDEQPDILELQRKMEFDKLKEILQNWLNPEDASDVEDDKDEDEKELLNEVKESVNDLPWDGEDEEVAVKPNYELKTKKSKADKFDELFDED